MKSLSNFDCVAYSSSVAESTPAESMAYKSSTPSFATATKSNSYLISNDCKERHSSNKTPFASNPFGGKPDQSMKLKTIK